MTTLFKMGLAVVFFLLAVIASASSRSKTCYEKRFFSGLNRLHWQSKGWVLAFRLTAGIGKTAYENYVSNSIDDDHPLARAFMPHNCLLRSGYCDRHYHSSILNHWPSRYVEKVRVALFKGQTRVAAVVFNASNSDSTSWFSHDRVTRSSWKDLKTESSNFFSILGHAVTGSGSRRFFIFRNYGGCPNDAGWLAVLDKTDYCSWGNSTSFPSIMYSKGRNYTNFNTDDVGYADVLTVSVKFTVPCKP